MISACSGSISALFAFGKKMAVIANNVANSQSDGFRKSRTVLTESPVKGVSAEAMIIESQGNLAYGEKEGKESVRKISNVDLSQEISHSLLTKRYYQANLRVITVKEEMSESLLDIIE